MSRTLEIGQEAKKWDEKSMVERMKIERRSLKRMGGSLVIYCGIMMLFSIIL